MSFDEFCLDMERWRSSDQQSLQKIVTSRTKHSATPSKKRQGIQIGCWTAHTGESRITISISNWSHFLAPLPLESHPKCCFRARQSSGYVDDMILKCNRRLIWRFPTNSDTKSLRRNLYLMSRRHRSHSIPQASEFRPAAFSFRGLSQAGPVATRRVESVWAEGQCLWRGLNLEICQVDESMDPEMMSFVQLRSVAGGFLDMELCRPSFSIWSMPNCNHPIIAVHLVDPVCTGLLHWRHVTKLVSRNK